jgi:hypothetical protein
VRLTERCKNQSQDHHDIRSQPASDAYAEGWARIWGSKREGNRNG